MTGRAPAFFDFVKERERVRLRKEADLIALENFEEPQGPPWTDDKILQDYKFTNVRRHHDRTSRVLRGLFYDKHFDDTYASILMNAATFRYFGTSEFAEVIGWTDFENMNEAHWDHVKETAASRLEAKKRVFTGAYVITNQGISAPKYEVVVDYFLKALHKKTEELIDNRINFNSWEQVAQEMRKINGFGGSGFMTKEILLDTTYTAFWDNEKEHPVDGKFSFPDDWWTWTPIGPGARRGAARVMGDYEAKPVSEAKASELIKYLCLDQDFHDMEPLTEQLAPHDIQFQLCEFDKYERVRLEQGKPRSRYRAELRR